MMDMRLISLTLTCQKGEEFIPFSQNLTVFHGQISAGKSSLVRLVDYCLGSKRLEATPAIRSELISAQLLVELNGREVILQRGVTDSSHVTVSWEDEFDSITLNAPLKAGDTPLWGDIVYNFSDLFFWLQGITPPKVRRAKTKDDSPFIRLSLRDLMWYCYLDQDNLDSSFFELSDVYKKLKSRDAMRFVTGYYTERLASLEILLTDTIAERRGKIQASEQLHSFLESFEFGSNDEVNESIDSSKRELEKTNRYLSEVNSDSFDLGHETDKLRQQLQLVSHSIANEEMALADLERKVAEYSALSAELLSLKMKLAKRTEANVVFSGVSYKKCPCCGLDVSPPKGDEEQDSCYLCRQDRTQTNNAIENSSWSAWPDPLRRIQQSWCNIMDLP